MSVASGEKVIVPRVRFYQTTECVYRLSVSAGLKQGDCAKVPEPCRRERIAPQIGVKTARGLIPVAGIGQPQGTHRCDSGLRRIECNCPVEMDPGQFVLTSDHVGIADRPMAPGVRLIERKRLSRQYDGLVQQLRAQVDKEHEEMKVRQPRVCLREPWVQVDGSPK